jgi:enediyne biosynthesis protein E9
MDIDHLSDVYLLIQGQGAQVLTANAVGGGSNLYLAASLRAPRETFERRDHRPGDGPDRRMWPQAISRPALDPYYARAEAGLRVRRPAWNEVSKSGVLWAATLSAAGRTCDRVPLAISEQRCVNAKWCHTGCIFGAKNSLITIGVNPSLTISALSERCAERLVARAPDLGLPAPPPSLSPGVPPQHIGERVVPGAA